MSRQFAQLLGAMRAEVERIPQTMRQEPVVRQAIIHVLANAVQGMGLIPLAAWKPPRSTRERLDLAAVVPEADPPRVEMAFAVDPLVELPKLKALEWVECPHKIVVTFSERKDKVDQTTFFLKPGLEHLNLYD